jgi:hypothetical protein
LLVEGVTNKPKPTDFHINISLGRECSILTGAANDVLHGRTSKFKRRTASRRLLSNRSWSFTVSGNYQPHIALGYLKQMEKLEDGYYCPPIRLHVLDGIQLSNPVSAHPAPEPATATADDQENVDIIGEA